MIDAEALHRAADQVWREDRTPEMDALADAAARFLQQSDLIATGPPDPDYEWTPDTQALGYGVMLGYLAAQEERR